MHLNDVALKQASWHHPWALLRTPNGTGDDECRIDQPHTRNARRTHTQTGQAAEQTAFLNKTHTPGRPSSCGEGPTGGSGLGKLPRADFGPPFVSC